MPLPHLVALGPRLVENLPLQPVQDGRPVGEGGAASVAVREDRRVEAKHSQVVEEEAFLGEEDAAEEVDEGEEQHGPEDGLPAWAVGGRRGE